MDLGEWMDVSDTPPNLGCAAAQWLQLLVNRSPDVLFPEFIQADAQRKGWLRMLKMFHEGGYDSWTGRPTKLAEQLGVSKKTLERIVDAEVKAGRLLQQTVDRLGNPHPRGKRWKLTVLSPRPADRCTEPYRPTSAANGLLAESSAGAIPQKKAPAPTRSPRLLACIASALARLLAWIASRLSRFGADRDTNRVSADAIRPPTAVDADGLCVAERERGERAIAPNEGNRGAQEGVPAPSDDAELLMRAESIWWRVTEEARRKDRIFGKASVAVAMGLLDDEIVVPAARKAGRKADDPPAYFRFLLDEHYGKEYVTNALHAANSRTPQHWRSRPPAHPVVNDAAKAIRKKYRETDQ